MEPEQPSPDTEQEPLPEETHLPSPTLQFVGGKIGIDATAKGPEEGTRPWPEEIGMSAEVRALVDGRWAEYGIPFAAPSHHGEMRHSSASLRRLLRR